jgi:hypothetical protein
VLSFGRRVCRHFRDKRMPVENGRQQEVASLSPAALASPD